MLWQVAATGVVTKWLVRLSIKIGGIAGKYNELSAMLQLGFGGLADYYLAIA